MIEIKEITNTANQEEFVSKNYLRRRAIFDINTDAVSIVKATKEKKYTADCRFDWFLGSICSYKYLGIITEDEYNRFLDALNHCRVDESCAKELIAPYMTPCGKIILKKYKESEV